MKGVSPGPDEPRVEAASEEASGPSGQRRHGIDQQGPGGESGDSASSPAEARPRKGFHTTRWSLVAAAGERSSAVRRQAQAELFADYWPPVYAFVRRRGWDAEESADLTQAFFTRLLEKDDLATADAARGRFRAFLCGCLRHFLANDARSRNTLRRGGAATVLSLDSGALAGADDDDRVGWDPEGGESPEQAYERAWARTVLARALERLAGEYARAQRSPLFEALRPTLAGDGEVAASELGAALGLSAGAVRVAAHRLRGRLAETLRREIADTVGDDPEAIEDELRGLFERLAAKRGGSA